VCAEHDDNGRPRHSFHEADTPWAGTADNAFRLNTGSGFNGDLGRLVIQPDGKIVVVG
jgi:hypothetical protein